MCVFVSVSFLKDLLCCLLGLDVCNVHEINGIFVQWRGKSCCFGCYNFTFTTNFYKHTSSHVTRLFYITTHMWIPFTLFQFVLETTILEPIFINGRCNLYMRHERCKCISNITWTYMRRVCVWFEKIKCCRLYNVVWKW